MIIIVDKPAGYTSHDVVAKIRRAYPDKIKIGHTGTLDPICTGVLTVLTGNYTRLSDLLPSDKVYRASIKLGLVTDTQDVTGAVIAENPCDVTCEDFCAVCNNFIGRQAQIPPMYSAVKKNGVPLYKLAREGKEVERAAREIVIYGINDIKTEGKNLFSFTVSCSSGTYIRTLCHDIGKALGCGACMASLRRIEANGFSIEDAHCIDAVIEAAQTGDLSSVSLDCRTAFRYLREITVPDNGITYFLNGGELDVSRFRDDIKDGELCLAYDGSSDFIGIAARKGGAVKCVWREN